MSSIGRLSRILCVLPLVVAGCSEAAGGGPGRTRPPPLVAVAKVEVRDVLVTVSSPVELRPMQVADVGSKILGYLGSVLVERGDRVSKGQLVATVRPSDLPDQLDAERAALSQAKAGRELAKVSLERARQLSPAGLMSAQELEQANHAVASAEAAEAVSKARLGALAVRLGETRILSPLDGVVLARRLDPGTLVGPGSAGTIVTVAQVDRMRVFVAVNEREAARIEVGQVAVVRLDAFPDRELRGTVVRVSPAFDSSTRTLDAEVELPNQSGDLRIGMYGRADIVLETHAQAVVAPVEAIVVNTLGRYAFVLEGDRVRRRAVTTGVDGGDWLEVLSGIAPGEEVVVTGAEALSDGVAVRAARPGDTAAGPAGPPEKRGAREKRPGAAEGRGPGSS
jgi:RND family efflux transporter MFP subunit